MTLAMMSMPLNQALILATSWILMMAAVPTHFHLKRPTTNLYSSQRCDLQSQLGPVPLISQEKLSVERGHHIARSGQPVNLRSGMTTFTFTLWKIRLGSQWGG